MNLAEVTYKTGNKLQDLSNKVSRDKIIITADVFTKIMVHPKKDF